MVTFKPRGFSTMKSLKALLFVAFGLSLWLGGCKVRHPGSAVGNQPPTTTLSVAPTEGDTVNYYITLGWAGNDPDGTVAGFYLYIDTLAAVFTTSRDTTIAFYSPQDSVPVQHTFKVQAVDDQGLADPNPPVRTFSVINRVPTASRGLVGITSGAVVGTNFRVSITSESPRPSSSLYSIAFDDTNAWSAWTPDTVFAFASPDLLSDPLFPQGVFGVSNDGLTPGPHVIYLRAQNGGGALSNTVVDSITVSSGPSFLPTIDATVAATYGAIPFYPDGSAYYIQASGQAISIAYSAHEQHGGEINAYRWRTGQIAGDGTIQWNDTWGPWQKTSVIDTVDLPVGNYPFEFMARDLSNNYTVPDSFIIRLVQQVISDSVIIVDDTKRSRAIPFTILPDSVNAFYDTLLTLAGNSNHRVVQFTLDSIPDPSRHGMTYLSPYDVHNAGLLIWHMEDANAAASDSIAARRIRILQDYLDKGGRIIMSGWNLMSKFESVSRDSVVFAGNGFEARYLKIFSGWRLGSQDFQCVGLNGANGFPAISVSPLKFRGNHAGQLNSCWTFDQQGQDIVVGTMAVADSATNGRQGRTAAYIYDLSYRIAVFGLPLYLCKSDEVQNLFVNPQDPQHSILTIMMQGLHPAM
jgi:hypothetical protein